MKLAIVGGGTMGLAYAHAWAKLEGDLAEKLALVERAVERREWLATHTEYQVEEDLDVVADANVVLLAVKPQDFEALAPELSEAIAKEALVISILAGVPLARLAQGLRGHGELVRCMPNIPAQIGAGASVYICASTTTQSHTVLAADLLGATGIAVRVHDEGLLDAATAIVGSGPAYLFALLERFIATAIDLGFQPADAEDLVRHTWEGALRLWRVSEKSPRELREMVTSKGGTTAAALTAFGERGLLEAFEAGVVAAFARSRELGRS